MTDKEQALLTIAEAMGIEIEIIANSKSQPPKVSNGYILAALEELNTRLNSKFRDTKVNKQLLTAIGKANYTLQDITRVVDYKIAEWGNDPAMKKYLVPATLFRFNNFEKYFDASHTVAANPLHELLKDDWDE